MSEELDYIVIAKFGAVHGIHGWISVYAYTEHHEDIFKYQPWFINRQSQWLHIQIVEHKIYQKGFLAKIKGIETREEARTFTGSTVNIPKSALPKLALNEYYWSDLIGLDVINQKGDFLGKVTQLIATGANDVLIVKNLKEHAIPFLPGSVIQKVDLPNQKIIVDWELI